MSSGWLTGSSDAEMALRHVGFVDLPPHARSSGGFDHAAVHGASGRLYVAHTANDAVEVIDLPARKHVVSVGGLPAVAGALVDDAGCLVFTSNRDENTVGIFSVGDERTVERVGVGVRPNGLSFDSGRGRLLVAHVGEPYTVAVVDVATRRRVADMPVAGRTRWTVFDPRADVFHVNVKDPPQIVVVSAGDPIGMRRVVTIPHAGPHGLDIDVAARRLYCACDDGTLVEVDADTGAVVAEAKIPEMPDVVFFNPALRHLYVAIGDPGVIDVFATAPLTRLETVVTEPGAHTIAMDATRNLVCAFLPQTHRASVYVNA
jgi:DNA-binding beta-propeller fold protein YncE